MHKLCHMGTFDYATWELSIMPCVNNIRQFQKTIKMKNIYLNLFFLEMHESCHVVMCNWLLGKFHIVVINCHKLHSQSIWFTIYLIHVHCVNVMFISCLRLNVGMTKLMQPMEKLVAGIIYN